MQHPGAVVDLMTVRCVDAYERAVARRSLRAGALWCALGVLGLALVPVFVVLIVNLRRQGLRVGSLGYLSMCGWVVVCSGAATSGWGSVQRARAVLRGVPLPEVADEPLLS